MIKTLEILVVEDSNSVIETYQEMVKAHNRHNNTLNVKIDVVDNLQDAFNTLDSLKKTYDGAVIDLDLNHSNGADQSGKQVIKFIKDNLRLPIFVISGTTNNLSGDELEENDLYKVVSRDDNFDFIEEFMKIHATGITDILNRTGKIEEFINTIYWKHLSTSLLPWIEDNVREDKDKKQSLIRYCIMHLQEYLDMSTDKEDSFSEYFPAEFFITGPIKPNLFTGDIIERDSKFFVVITPACDLGNCKAEKVLCLEINALSKIEEKFNKEEMSKSDKNIIRKYLSNKNDRYHFVPSLYFKGKTYEAGILDFQNQISIDFEELNNNSSAKRIATISQPFLKDLTARYARYYSRQGAPNISKIQLESAFFK